LSAKSQELVQVDSIEKKNSMIRNELKDVSIADEETSSFVK
jgi:hypothetical protein